MRNTLNRRLAALSPSVTILLGRGTSQAGLFLFLVGPALTLSDEAYNQLTIGVTVMFLAVVAPVGAFQQHLLRLEATSRATREAMQKSLALAVLCAAVGVVILSLFGEPRWWWLALCGGAVACAVPTLVASLHALASGFGRSAVLDGASGILFAAVAVIAVATKCGTAGWAAGFAAVWIISAILALRGPLQYRHPGQDASIGPLLRVARDARAMIAIGVLAMAFNRADYLVLAAVGSDLQAARYALAARVVGPVLIALGSLNNSLYVRQIHARDDPVALRHLTERASKRVGLLAIAVVPVSVFSVWALGELSDALAARELLAPTFVLALATVPYAFAIPYGFALNAQYRERTWLCILLVATIVDLVVVLIVGPRGAVPVALAWLAVQIGVWATVTRGVDPLSVRRREIVTTAR